MIGAAIPICEKDSVYLDTLLPEIERMGVDVAWLANNCSEKTVDKLKRFKRTISVDVHDGSFNNCMRQYPLDALKKAGYEWMLQWDADETWEKFAPGKLRRLLKDQKMITVRMAHVWEMEDGRYVTMDWSTERDRIYNLKYSWVYNSAVTAGPTCLDEEVKNGYPENVWMIHWGYSTDEKRKSHKIRWDTNHGRSIGKNPYGQWNTITEEGYVPNLVSYEQFQRQLEKIMV